MENASATVDYPNDMEAEQNEAALSEEAQLVEATSPVEEAPVIQEARLWSGNGWTARVIKNEEDEGWAVAMLRDGEPEPALVGPWTMGRDKKNPKPLDAFAFSTLVKTASEVIRRHEQQREALLHKTVYVTDNAVTTKVMLDITPDEDNPSATLSAYDESGERLAQVRVDPGFKLNAVSATSWIESGFVVPGRSRGD